MQYSQTNTPRKLNLDKASKYLTPEESFYLLNNEINDELGSSTPMAANYLLCEMELPAGETHTAGSFKSPITNEVYSWKYNSNGVHFISRINEDGTCQVVYYGECLQVSAAPERKITKFRAFLRVDRLCHKVPGGMLKQLVWVDGDIEIACLDVEASIATQNFTTPFFDLCKDDCATLQLCVPQPDRCLHGEFLPRTIADKGLTNYIVDKGLKFMYQHEYYDGRRSEWSDRSTLYYQNAKGCFDNEQGYSRGMVFQVPLGNPLVEKINIGVSEDGGVTYSLYETIEKYKQYSDSAQYWFERGIREDLKVDYNNCTFEYRFYNDRQRTPIAPTQLTRLYNPQPRKVQSLLPMPKGAIGFVNYEKGVCPISKTETDKFKIDKTCQTDTTCNTELVEVKVRAIIYNFYLSNHGNNNPNWFIYRDGGTAGAADDPTDVARFGCPNADIDTPIYEQRFGGKARNFIPYIEGTDLQVEMTQWRKKNGVSEKVGVIAGQPKRAGTFFFNYDDFDVIYEEASFFVNKGTKGFIRLGSHLNDNSLGRNQNTSTQVKGIFNFNEYKGGKSLPFYRPAQYEVYFDTCNGVTNGVLELNDGFVIEDLWTTGSGKTSSAFNGYIYDGDNLPVEGAQIYANGGVQTITDHNGFYSFYNFDGDTTMSIEIRVEMDCGAFRTIETFTATSGELKATYTDHKIESEDYKNKNLQPVKIKVTDCDGNPVSGIRIAVSGSKYKSTQEDGYAFFKFRNYVTRNREIRAIVMDKGGCIISDCSGNCNPCMPSLTRKLPTCFNNPTVPIVVPTPMVINTKGIATSKRGLKAGGRYPFGIVAEGSCGRISAVNEINYLDIPKIQEKKGLGFCELSFSIGSMILPDWVERLKIVRGENLNNYILQWVVDGIERTSNGNLKITIQSLNDYNAMYNFKTNTAYKYAAGDRVEFIKNADGTYFDADVNYQVLSPYNDTVISGVTDAPADFFNQILIPDSDKLQGLKEGAIIEIQSPKVYSDKPEFFEICATIPVVNGKPAVTSGTFETFDTYLVARQLGKFPSQLFEHKAPTDFYSNLILDDRGKVHFINEYENEKRYGRNITVNNPLQFNYFGDFEKTFDVAEQGDIIGITLKDEKIGLAISQNDSFLFSVADDLLRVGRDNVIRAANADELISSPQPKLRGVYGCQYEDIGSIFFGDGYATWIDAKVSNYIVHNYQEARIAGLKRTQEGVESTCSSFFKRRVREKESANRNETEDLAKFRYSTGINTKTKRVYLTLKRLRDAGINNAQEKYLLPNDTIIYNPETDDFEGFASFTPEDYNEIDLKTEGGCAFISFQNALPYVHPLIPEKANEFFGVACDWMVGTVLNKGTDKVKIPLSIEVQSHTMFFVASVTTSLQGFKSEIPAIRWKKSEGGKWNAAFLNNINSVGGLFDGEKAKGFYFNVLFIRDNTINLTYNSKDDSKRTAFSSLDSILFKFMVVEQSGFTGNL